MHRSLIALSLIMSLLQFKPAPMYILDEVDAALDLSHTQHIGHLFRTRFKGSQFIVVSLKVRCSLLGCMSSVTRRTGGPVHQRQRPLPRPLPRRHECRRADRVTVHKPGDGGHVRRPRDGAQGQQVTAAADRGECVTRRCTFMIVGRRFVHVQYRAGRAVEALSSASFAW